MTRNSSLVFSGLAPHPPIMVPEVGRGSITSVSKSTAGMAEMTRRIVESGADSVIIISPHAPLLVEAFVAYNGPEVTGDFSNFSAPGTCFTSLVDQELLGAIQDAAALESYEVVMLPENELDHGTAVPLYFLLRNGWQGKVVTLGYSFLSNEDHLRFGSCIRKAIDQVGRSVAFVASGDLSHRLKPSAPAGYDPDAHYFDDQVVAALRENQPGKIVGIDYGLRKLAGECGYRSLLVAIGASAESQLACEVLSYEAPFGVGYLVAQLFNQSSDAIHDEGKLDELPALARKAVEKFVKSRRLLTAPKLTGLLGERAPCFVSLKTQQGDLRGCIGTIEPARETLAEEIIANAISAATNDPRFEPVGEQELSNLRYSVDVLLPAEHATMSDLDPAVYGVIVEDEGGGRRGLLLPDIPGIVDATTQVEIAARKAGIAAGEPVTLWRFKVERFRE